MRNVMKAAGTAFWRDRSGGLATAFAATVVVAMGTMAAGLDYVRLSAKQSTLQKATDAAALAAAQVARTKQGNPAETARNVFNANIIGTDVSSLSHGLSIKDGNYIYTASANVKAAVLQSIGLKQNQITAKSTATFGASEEQPIEVVIVIDTTTSVTLISSSWGKAVAAVNDMLNVLKTKSSGEFYVTLIPMTDRINVGWRSSWMDVNPMPADYRGCVEPREENLPGFPYALTDAPPTGHNKFKPSIAGSLISPNISMFYNNGDLPSCSSSPITGPTSSVSEIENAMLSLRTLGTGRFDEGMAWAWRALSPKWRGHWGVPNYPAKSGDRRKIVLFITDGYTSINEWEIGGASGNIYGRGLGSEMGFNHFVRVCKEMKNQDIEIYSIYLSGNRFFSPFAKQCASSGDHYFIDAANMNTFEKALEKIGTGKSTGNEQVRLIR